MIFFFGLNISVDRGRLFPLRVPIFARLRVLCDSSAICLMLVCAPTSFSSVSCFGHILCFLLPLSQICGITLYSIVALGLSFVLHIRELYFSSLY